MHCCSSRVVAFHVTSFHVVALIHSSRTIGSTTKILNFFKPEILVKKIRLGAQGGGGGGGKKTLCHFGQVNFNMSSVMSNFLTNKIRTI